MSPLCVSLTSIFPATPAAVNQLFDPKFRCNFAAVNSTGKVTTPLKPTGEQSLGPPKSSRTQGPQNPDL